VRLNTGLIALSISAAIGLHLAGTLVFRSATVAGMEGFRADVAALSGRPEFAQSTPASPIRVVLGRAERAPFDSPGPRASLDPATIRRPPSLGPLPPDAGTRLEATLDLFTPHRSEPGRALIAELPNTGTPSWADAAMSLEAVDLALKPVTRQLASRFLPYGDLPALAAKQLLRIAPREAAADLRLAPDSHQLPVPTSWPEPDVALRVVEVFFDPLE
jgi:hypothetical protein